jgi:Uma2 family endonuclease
MAALPDPITVEQFRQLPRGGEFAYELHDGKVLAVTRPKPRHWKLQSRIRRLLEPKLKAFGEVEIELPFRPVAEFNLRAADVAAISR